MSDLISRKAAIDAIMDADVCVTWNGVISDDDAVDIAIKSTKGSVISSIVNMPSAQPETHDKRTKTHSCDCISRQAAIDAVEESRRLNHHQDGKAACAHEYEHRHFLKLLRDLPSVQPEVLACGEGELIAQPEIVRCKDCMYWVAHDKRCVYLNHGFAPNMWCCHAERRTDEV